LDIILKNNNYYASALGSNVMQILNYVYVSNGLWGDAPRHHQLIIILSSMILHFAVVLKHDCNKYQEPLLDAD